MEKATPTPRKKRQSPTEPIFDQDDAWKTYMSKDFFDFLQATQPKLYAAVDKTVPVEFLEQEFHNSLRGKYKFKGKEKRLDKLAKLRLLTNEDCYVYCHSEIQDDLKDNLPERVFMYRNFISLRFNTQAITSIVFFTGKAPSDKHKVLALDTFGTTLNFKYNTYVIAEQDTARLEQSDNIFDLAILAAKYTLDTEGDLRKRFVFKQKLFELAQKKQFSLDKINELLSFVFDYMLLPDKMEQEFISITPFLQSKNDNTMEVVMTRGKRLLMDMNSMALFGKPLNNYIEDTVADAVADAVAAKKAERQHVIRSLKNAHYSSEQIAQLLGFDLEEVRKVQIES